MLVDAEVTSFVIIRDSHRSDSHVEYVITCRPSVVAAVVANQAGWQVGRQGGDSWSTQQRFSAFRDLDKSLRQAYLENKRNQLNTYLRAVLAHPALGGCAPLLSFLQAVPHPHTHTQAGSSLHGHTRGGRGSAWVGGPGWPIFPSEGAGENGHSVLLTSFDKQPGPFGEGGGGGGLLNNPARVSGSSRPSLAGSASGCASRTQTPRERALGESDVDEEHTTHPARLILQGHQQQQQQRKWAQGGVGGLPSNGGDHVVEEAGAKKRGLFFFGGPRGSVPHSTGPLNAVPSSLDEKKKSKSVGAGLFLFGAAGAAAAAGASASPSRDQSEYHASAESRRQPSVIPSNAATERGESPDCYDYLSESKRGRASERDGGGAQGQKGSTGLQPVAPVGRLEATSHAPHVPNHYAGGTVGGGGGHQGQPPAQRRHHHHHQHHHAPARPRRIQEELEELSFLRALEGRRNMHLRLELRTLAGEVVRLRKGGAPSECPPEVELILQKVEDRKEEDEVLLSGLQVQEQAV
uniref:PX domain-containing protein n=1 Tax=Chromera velia CCMP2878 TaxID=1169474 RepID=A0A0G4HSI3_9ALVE|eukprot:Cvel_8294.t1-p1 / transcript=Cvel_8294.t1 / gene=Cvel_8294 / organism=Chromera_velia_CCMP2878 / gene_product=hypothetical protein / transcript_product=hypothetical protein / location=Cvel_scaffold455:33529-36964(-) / protein_length=519 / sequence_SO=supercontig / SO=protein_coding / is_pseudo=false